MGFGIALDDLGAGYSSLRLWSELRPDYVKIDRYFIDGIHQDVVKREFVESILKIARASRAQVIAEGIELAQERRRCRTWASTWSGLSARPPAGTPALDIDDVLPSAQAQQNGLNEDTGDLSRCSYASRRCRPSAPYPRCWKPFACRPA